MKIPTAIRVGPVRYRVEITKKLHDAKNGDERLDGECCYKEARIRVDDFGDEQFRRVVIWHEVLHAILHERAETQPPEATIDALAYGVMQVLQDNPWLRG